MVEEKIPPGPTPKPQSPIKPIASPTNLVFVSEIVPKLALNRLRIILYSVFGLILASVLVFAGYKLGQNQIKPTSSSSFGPTPTPNPTINWQTYKNNIFFYELKFPKNWVETETSFNFQETTSFKAPDGSWLEIIVNKEENQTLDEYLESLDEQRLVGFEGEPSVEVAESKKKTVAGYLAIERKEEKLAAGLTTIVTYILIDDQFFSFTVFPREDGELAKSEAYNKYRQVLSTFKFLSLTNSVQEEKTFCDEPRPEVCTMECIINPPYICGSNDQSYCSVCAACADWKADWYLIQDEPCGI